jgi:hypothetical protein
MSMIGNFRMSSDSEIRSLLAAPETIEALLYPESGGQAKGAREMDVDKAWQAIHFLLCGDPWGGKPPLNFIVSGGQPVGDVDVGYGPARVFMSAEVREIARALEPITADQLRAKYDSKTFFANQIYPEIWNEPIEECFDSYVLSYFNDLKTFVLQAREENKALIVYVN